MKDYEEEYFFIAVLLAFTSCKKKSGDIAIETPVDNGPWGGVYKMISTQTKINDTLDATPCGGGVITIRSERRDGETFTEASLLIKPILNLKIWL